METQVQFEIDGADARIAALESFVQFVGNALDLHDDETDLGIEFRSCSCLRWKTQGNDNG